MANKIFAVDAPEELMQAVIDAYASKAGVASDADADVKQEAAIEGVLGEWRQAVVQYQVRMLEAQQRAQSAAAAEQVESAMKSQRDSVTVTIT
jgi:hypothetical protein